MTLVVERQNQDRAYAIWREAARWLRDDDSAGPGGSDPRQTARSGIALIRPLLAQGPPSPAKRETERASFKHLGFPG